MPLEEYQKKRNFSKTNEPKAVVKKSKQPIFSVQEHNASHLHWDLRLEINGVLKSWAVPKEPANDSAVKRLAIQTEDHPLAYAKFEGTIPAGQYGAGTVKLWDTGKLKIIDKKDEKIIFELGGKKLKGEFVLVKTKFAKNSWLFFKKKD